MNQIEGDLIATDLKIAFVVSRFNEFVCERLLEGALDSLARHGGNKDEVTVLRVPGAFELPLAAKKLAESGKFAAIGIGMWLGLIMAFNVWFIIWPNQKKALGIVESSPEEKPVALKKAVITSRINTLLSLPMLLSMVAAQNLY